MMKRMKHWCFSVRTLCARCVLDALISLRRSCRPTYVLVFREQAGLLANSATCENRRVVKALPKAAASAITEDDKMINAHCCYGNYVDDDHHSSDCSQLVLDKEAARMVRASGACICDICGKTYYKHPFTDHRDWNGDPWLNRLCDGRIAKL